MLKIINKNNLLSVLFVAILVVIFFSSIGFADAQTTRIVPCDGPDCNFNSAIQLMNNIIDWVISIAGVLFTIGFVYGGFLYMTSGENPGNKAKAKSLLWSLLKGFVIILVSWLIVYTILTTLIPDETGSSYRTTIFRFIGTGQ